MPAKETKKIEILNEHLPYELGMLKSTYTLMQKGIYIDGKLLIGGIPINIDAFRDINQNMLIEVFCLHARNLIDFFSMDPTSKGDAVAKDFIEKYHPLIKRSEIKKIPEYLKLHQHIAHITYKRTAKPEEKIDGKARKKLLDIILSEEENFYIHLGSAYKAHYKRV